MNVKQMLSVSLLCLAGSGCSLFDNFIHTTVVEPLHYARHLDETASKKHFRGFARSAFEVVRAHARADLGDYECEPFSADYQLGFEDGFVDFLDAGGLGSPPTLPPRRYWKAKYQTPHGQGAVTDWFSGYERGAAAAQESGWRQLVLVPVSDSLVSTTEPHWPRAAEIIERLPPTAKAESSD